MATPRSARNAVQKKRTQNGRLCFVMIRYAAIADTIVPPVE